MIIKLLRRWLRNRSSPLAVPQVSRERDGLEQKAEAPDIHSAAFQIDVTSADASQSAIMATGFAPVLHSPDPVSLYNTGNALADNGEFEQAIEKYSLAIECDDLAYANYNEQLCLMGYPASPFDPADGLYTSTKTFFNRGRAYEALGRLPQAIADYSQVISMCSDFKHAYLARGGACLELAAELRSKKALNKAEELLLQAGEDALHIATEPHCPKDVTLPAADLTMQVRSELMMLRRELEGRS